MSKKQIIIGFCVLLVGAGIFGGYKAWIAISQKNVSSALFSQFKTYCKTTETSPYENYALGFHFQFNDDVLVCDYQPPNQIGKTHEIYLWNKGVFNGSTPAGFGFGVIGKITINPLPGLPIGTTVAEESGTVAGKSVTIKTVHPSSCVASECPTSRVVELSYQGDIYILEEYILGTKLLETFEFIPKRRSFLP